MRCGLLWFGVAGLLLSTGLAYSQSARLQSAQTVNMPSRADCNSPGFWRDAQFSILNSTGVQMISHGGNQFSQSATQQVRIDRTDHLPMWIESVWQDSDGTLHGWYHHEPAGVCPGSKLTAPEIGAVVSHDGGLSFEDLGLVLTSGDPVNCGARNGFFAGGNGDFSVILDRKQEYFYFLFDNYGGPLSGQGVALARMAFADRAQPAGAVWKYFRGDWTEPGLGGQLTPVFPASVGWEQPNTDSYWGPSVHWNTYLETYVVLLSHACCKPQWPQEGIYIAFNPDLADPGAWTKPVKLLGKVDYDAGYYPQVIGTDPEGADTLAGQQARFYVHGRSNWEIVFSKEPFSTQQQTDPGDSDNPPTNIVNPNAVKIRR